MTTTAEDDANAASVTTVKEYSFVPDQRLPEVKGTAAYKPMEDNTVRFALNVWAGWAPIIYANNGFKSEKVWKTPDGQSFKVELVLIDDPVAMHDAYSSGEVHIGWAHAGHGSVVHGTHWDRLADSRVMPRIFQQVDWSNGGDGIVVRENVKTVADLRNKKGRIGRQFPFAILPAEHAGRRRRPALGGQTGLHARCVPGRRRLQCGDRSISAAVSWAPDIYNLEKVQGNKLLVTTAVANKLIADVWFARADFAQDHPEHYRRAGPRHLRRDGRVERGCGQAEESPN